MHFFSFKLEKLILNKMKVLLLFIILHLQLQEIECFFPGSTNSILNLTNRNLVCLNQITITYNGTTTYNYGNFITTVNNNTVISNRAHIADYCIVYQITQTRNGLLEVQTTWTLTASVNEFRDTAITR